MGSWPWWASSGNSCNGTLNLMAILLWLSTNSDCCPEGALARHKDRQFARQFQASVEDAAGRLGAPAYQGVDARIYKLPLIGMTERGWLPERPDLHPAQTAPARTRPRAERRLDDRCMRQRCLRYVVPELGVGCDGRGLCLWQVWRPLRFLCQVLSGMRQERCAAGAGLRSWLGASARSADSPPPAGPACRPPSRPGGPARFRSRSAALPRRASAVGG